MASLWNTKNVYLVFQSKAEDCKMEPTETEERGTELKTETKEEEDQPSTSATQSSPAPGQSKKKSRSLRLSVPGDKGEKKPQDLE